MLLHSFSAFQQLVLCATLNTSCVHPAHQPELKSWDTSPISCARSPPRGCGSVRDYKAYTRSLNVLLSQVAPDPSPHLPLFRVSVAHPIWSLVPRPSGANAVPLWTFCKCRLRSYHILGKASSWAHQRQAASVPHLRDLLTVQWRSVVFETDVSIAPSGLGSLHQEFVLLPLALLLTWEWNMGQGFKLQQRFLKAAAFCMNPSLPWLL